jgi:hypothetical protein
VIFGPHDVKWAPRMFTAELIDSCIMKLSIGKACGPHDLSAEHFINAHHCISVISSNLFKQIIVNRYVLDQFEAGLIIPLIKDKSHNFYETKNYRPITLSCHL